MGRGSVRPQNGRTGPIRMSDHTKAFCDCMREISDGGRKRRWEIFRRFLRIESYCTSIAKPWQMPERQEKLEERYMAGRRADIAANSSRNSARCWAIRSFR